MNAGFLKGKGKIARKNNNKSNNYFIFHQFVTGVYIIHSQNWKKDYYYRGNGNTTPGINIDYGTSNLTETTAETS